MSSSSSKADVANGYLFRIYRPDSLQTTIYYRNGSIGLFDETSSNFSWVVPPKSYFVDFIATTKPDGTKEVAFENGTTVRDMPPPNPGLPEFERVTAVQRIVSHSNGTEIRSYFNGTVALFETGSFVRYIVPPKSIFVTVTVYTSTDGSYNQVFSNGTRIFFAGPPPANETAEQKAFRFVKVVTEPGMI